MPSSSARAFIMETNASLEPAMCSPRATHASFAEPTSAALISSLTVMVSPGSSQIWEPPIDAAYSLQVTVSSIVILPASSASNTNSMVMILVIEASGSCWFSLTE